MLIDCQTCPVREVHCADCMVTALTRPPGSAVARDPGSEATVAPRRHSLPGLPLDPAERRAVSIFVAAGLIGRADSASLTATMEPVRGRGPSTPRRRAAG